MNEKEFKEKFDEIFDTKVPDFSKTLNIVVVGKVSTGKSSLINAIFGRDRDDPISPVGSVSGVTTEVTSYKFGDDVLLIDCPGLDDVIAKNSEETKNFLSEIDLGLFVITGSADATQKKNYDDLKKPIASLFFAKDSFGVPASKSAKNYATSLMPSAAPIRPSSSGLFRTQLLHNHFPR